ncbi:MAG: TrmH family RNA methyltransferase [Caldilineaceae bacterium]
MAKVTNLNRAIDTLKETNVWVASTDMGDDTQPLEKVDLTGALALAVGSEGSGLSRLTREKCRFPDQPPHVWPHRKPQRIGGQAALSSTRRDVSAIKKWIGDS